MAKRTARRTKTAHPGVKLKKRTLPSGRVTWLARWIDPDEGRELAQSLDAIDVTSAEARRRWAIDKSRAIAQRKRELASGATPHTGTSIADALALYFEHADIGDSTRDNYKAGAERFAGWCKRQGLRSTDDLRAEHLASFRAWLRAAPARAPKAGGRRGEKAAGTSTNTAATANNRLRGVKVILNELRRRGLLPHVDKDAISDQMRTFKEERPRAAFLKPQALRKLIEAAQRHDAATSTLGSGEADQEATASTARELAEMIGVHESRVSQLRRQPGFPAGPPWRVGDVLEAVGARKENEPIAPLVLVSLLTGGRLEELLGLRWEHVDLDHPDGIVELSGKTGPREVWLDVTPSLKRLLLAMKLRSSGPFVFGGEEPWTKTVANKARRRLIDKHGAPDFTWSQRKGRTPSLRATCATYSTNAGGIWGAAAHYASAKRLGHSVTIAEKRYAGRWRVPREARDLEQAMQVTDAIAELVDALTGRPALAEAV